MIRVVREGEDLVEVANLEALLFPDNSMSPALLEREARVSQVLVIGEPIHAYAIVGGDEPLDLLRLGVHPNHQGQGLGAYLLDYITSMGRDVMLTVRKDNQRALHLYKKHGFRIVGHFIPECAWALYREAACTVCPSTP